MKKLLVLISLAFILTGWAYAQYTVDFEGTGETKSSYASGSVSLSGLSWNMTDALIGTLAGDWKNGVRSCRMRGYGTSAVTMLANYTSGASSVSFSYRRYGTDAQVDWKVEYSINDGSSWIQLGNSFTAPASDVVQQFSASLNVSGNIRIRIKRATETGTLDRRLNIDDITLSSNQGPTPPDAPVALSASNIGINSFTANWGAVNGATGYYLDVAANGAFSPMLAGYSNLNVLSTSQAVSGLAGSSTYYYRVRASNTAGTSGDSNIISVTTLSPEPFDGYYNTVNGLSGANLKAGLHTLIRTTHTTEYGYTNLEEQMKITDEDPNNSNNVIELYTGWSVPKSTYGGATTDWNKEHTWSKSHGDFGDIAPAGTDLHHLRPCDATVNSFKNNRDFDEGSTPYTDSSPPSGYSGTTYCYSDADEFEPRDEDKGDVARMIFYMAVRYEGTDTSYDLELVDYTYSDAGTNQPYYGKLSTLLAWHVQDPPDAWEALRNNRTQNLQGNRNPFIDHPEYVGSIWGGGTATTYVQFSPNSATVNEADGSINLNIMITDPNAFTATTANVILSSGDAADVGNYTTQSVSFPASSSASQSVSVSITNDLLPEGTETLVFSLANVSGGTNAAIGTNGSFTLYINDGIVLPPVAIPASAISHEGFTARWNAVSGALGYRLDVYTGSSSTASDLIISEYVEGSSTNKYIEIFNGTGAEIDLSNYILRLYSNGSTSPSSSALSGTLASGSCAVFQNSGAVLSLPAGVTAMSNGAVNFNGDDALVLYNTNTASNVDIFGRIGEDPGTAWTSGTITTLDRTLRRKPSILSGVSDNPTSGFPTLGTQWDSFATDTADGLGSHSLSGGSSYLAAYQDLAVSPILARVSGLDPNSSYSYVVRAVHAGGTTADSNPIEVSTTSVITGTGANTSIAGANTAILLPTISGYSNNSLELDPLATTNDDYSVIAATISSGLSYSISSADNGALNGTYILHHDGLGYAPQGVQYSFGGNTYQASLYTSTALQTELTISGLAKNAKGTLSIDLLQEPTLPVELSSFTAIINSHNNVALQWVSQSESGMLGYYVLRSMQTELGNASIISPLLTATNTSQQQVYVFVDTELTDSGTYYYWLQNLDMDGVSGFYGPLSIAYTGNSDGNHSPELATAFVSAYPNPFSQSTLLHYTLAKTSEVQFTIYNLKGQIVSKLNPEHKLPGSHDLHWNGRDEHGRPCSSGLYYIVMRVDGANHIRKVIIAN